ncbi:MAG: site-2 protease family protein [Clostridiales bacterium]|nr:site-2 protease family protein [Candidatus Apopatousia equi]
MSKVVFKFHWSFLILGMLMIYFGKSLLFFCYIITCVIHELGHAIVGRALGYKLNIISLMPYGASLSGNNVPFRPKDEILIAIAGPLVNLLIVILLLASWWLFPFIYNYTQDFFWSNFSTLLFNLLPVFPLDGGRLLMGILDTKFERKKSFKICKIVGIIITAIFFLLFFISIFYGINYSMGMNAIFLLIGLFDDDKSIYYINVNTLEDKNLSKGMLLKTVAIDEHSSIYDAYRLLDKNNINQIYVMDEKLKVKRVLMESELEKLIVSVPLNTRLIDIKKETS